MLYLLKTEIIDYEVQHLAYVFMFHFMNFMIPFWLNDTEIKVLFYVVAFVQETAHFLKQLIVQFPLKHILLDCIVSFVYNWSESILNVLVMLGKSYGSSLKTWIRIKTTFYFLRQPQVSRWKIFLVFITIFNTEIYYKNKMWFNDMIPRKRYLN